MYILTTLVTNLFICEVTWLGRQGYILINKRDLFALLAKKVPFIFLNLIYKFELYYLL